MNYEHKVQREIADWEYKMFKPPGWLEKTSKTIGNRINHLIPPESSQYHYDHHKIDRAYGTVWSGVYT